MNTVTPGTAKAREIATYAEALGAVGYFVETFPPPHEKEVFGLQFFDANGLNVATHVAGFSAASLLVHPGGREWKIEKPPLRPIEELKR